MRTLLLGLLLTTPALADDLPRIAYPVPSKYPSPDGRLVLVLIPPKAMHPKERENSDHAALRKQYSVSGLYAKDDATKPLWPVDWFDYDAYPANDGIHVVRIHGENSVWRHFPSGNRLDDEIVREQLASPAVTFYANGQPLRTYTVRELVTKPDDLPQTMKYILWSAGCTITQDGKQFVMMTQDARQVIFDLATGAIVENREAGLGNAKVWVIRFSLAVVGMALIVTMSLYLYFLNKKESPATP